MAGYGKTAGLFVKPQARQQVSGLIKQGADIKEPRQLRVYSLTVKKPSVVTR